jgi:hypothetical protein
VIAVFSIAGERLNVLQLSCLCSEYLEWELVFVLLFACLLDAGACVVPTTRCDRSTARISPSC